MAVTPTYPVKTIAKLLMLTERRVQQLTAEGVIPKAERGRYELAPAVQGYIRYLQERSLRSDVSPVDYHVEKARLTKLQADKAALELAIAKAEVAPVADFRKAEARGNAIIRNNMRNLPQRVVVQLLGETNETRFKQVLLAEIDAALVASANTDISLEDDEDAEG